MLPRLVKVYIFSSQLKPSVYELYGLFVQLVKVIFSFPYSDLDQVWLWLN